MLQIVSVFKKRYFKSVHNTILHTLQPCFFSICIFYFSSSTLLCFSLHLIFFEGVLILSYQNSSCSVKDFYLVLRNPFMHFQTKDKSELRVSNRIRLPKCMSCDRRGANELHYAKLRWLTTQ